MLILGIETATHQVGCAIGGHEGVLALFESARDRRHAETLVPAIQFVTKQARIELDEIGVVAVDVGPGSVHRPAGRHRRREGDSERAASPDGRRARASTCSRCRCGTRAGGSSRSIDARRGELFYAFYRPVPGGVQRLSPHQVGTPDDLASELQATGEDMLLVGDGALGATRRPSRTSRGVELVEQWLAHPSAAPLVQLAHSYALREEFVNPWDLQPVYLRRPDAEINWETRDSR